MSGRLAVTCFLLLSSAALSVGCDTPPSPADGGPDAPGLRMSRLLGRCVVDEQCPGNGAFCRTAAEDGFPGGQCSIACTDRTECDDGTAYNFCAMLNGETQNACLPICRNGSDCAHGYSCQNVGSDSAGNSIGYCFPVCATDDECGDGTQCNPYTGRCVPHGMVPTVGGDTGDACTGNDSCLSQDCIEQTASNGYVGGYCISLCRISAGFNSSDFFSGDTLPAGTCGGTSSVCIPYGSQNGEGDLGICLAACTSDGDCRPGFACTQSVGLSSGGTHTFTNGWCDPIDCLTQGACPTGTTCHRGTDSNGNPLGRCG